MILYCFSIFFNKFELIFEIQLILYPKTIIWIIIFLNLLLVLICLHLDIFGTIIKCQVLFKVCFSLFWYCLS